MAQVTVRVKINRTFEVSCNGENEEQCLDDIANRARLDDEFTNACYEAMTFEEGTFDEEEPPEEEDEEETRG